MDEVFLQAPLFAALDAEGASALRASLTETEVVKGDVLFAEGEPGDRMYVILEGKVKLGQTSGDGRESLLAVLGPGEMFGELSLFDPGARTTQTALGLVKQMQTEFGAFEQPRVDETLAALATAAAGH